MADDLPYNSRVKIIKYPRMPDYNADNKFGRLKRNNEKLRDRFKKKIGDYGNMNGLSLIERANLKAERYKSGSNNNSIFVG